MKQFFNYEMCKILILVVFSLFFNSCAKDSDFFLETVLEEEKPVINNDDTIIVNKDSITVGTPGNNSVNIDFGFEVGNNIPLQPENPKRTIYISVEGRSSNTGLTLDSPKNIASAFDKSFVKAGDLFYIKAGNYTMPSNPKDNRQFDISDLPCTANDPCYWVGYKSIPGDINASEFSTVTWDDYKNRPQSNDGTHNLDPSLMPTFSGNTTYAPKYIDNGTLFFADGGEEGLVFRNLQIQYFRRGFELKRLSTSVFENIIQANHGWFAPINGQGGSNSDLQGTGWLIYSSSSSLTSVSVKNVIKNCATYNMAFRGFTINNSTNTLVERSESTSDIDNGNPQDYYFHTIGKNNLFSNLRVNRLISSNHSGHGICFNQLSENNIMQNSVIYGTGIHFDGAINSYANNIQLIGDDSFGLFKGGGITIMDGAENNLIENCSSVNGETGINFSDSGKNPFDEHAGRNNSFKNIKITNKSKSIIDLNWWNEKDELTENNIFENCEFINSPYLFTISRPNSNFIFNNSQFINVKNIQQTTYKNEKNFLLNSNTQFKNSNFWDSEIPTKEKYIVSNLTNNPK